MRSFAIFTFIVLGSGAIGCDVEGVGPEAGSRDALVERAESQASLALENYADCESEPEPVCEGEEAELVEALVELDEAQGPDRLEFRTTVTASCANGGSVSCSGNACYVADNIGCACVSGQTLQSAAGCPPATNEQ